MEGVRLLTRVPSRVTVEQIDPGIDRREGCEGRKEMEVKNSHRDQDSNIEMLIDISVVMKMQEEYLQMAVSRGD